MGQNISTAVMQRRHVTVDKLDYYPTPPWATRAFMAEVLRADASPHLFANVWEPACGEGHMAEVLREFSPNVIASDVHDYGRGYKVGSFVGDGLDVIPRPPRCHWVITNPPFNLAVEFAQRAIREADVGVALLLRSAWSEGMERYRELFERNPPDLIAQYCERVPMVAGRYDPQASSATAYSWFVWVGPAQVGRTVFQWIKPGAKDRHFRVDDVRRWARPPTKEAES